MELWRKGEDLRSTKASARAAVVVALALAVLSLSSECSLAGQEPPPHRYSIKPSEVVLPEGVAPGQYRRIIQPFSNWTLICDENLKRKQRICNVTQTIVDERDTMAFSWSLAATAEGQPIMILRLPAEVGKGSPVTLSFAGRNGSVSAKTGDCDQNVCLILLPVGPVLREQINKQAAAQISYDVPAQTDGRVVINTTFQGLPTALAAIN